MISPLLKAKSDYDNQMAVMLKEFYAPNLSKISV